MKNAKRLNLPSTPSSFIRAGRITEKHAFHKNESFPRLVRRYVPRDPTSAIKNLLPKELQEYVLEVSFSEIHLIETHVHLSDECVINFYQKTGGEVTTFWEGPVVKDDRTTEDNGNRYIHIRRSLLTPEEFFIAKNGEVWLLNTRYPHSVSNLFSGIPRKRHFSITKEHKPREALQVFFSLPYCAVLAILEKSGLVIDDN